MSGWTGLCFRAATTLPPRFSARPCTAPGTASTKTVTAWSAAPGLEVTARAPDGIIEALEVPGHPFGLGVQWHPEWLQHMPEMRNLFRVLATSASSPTD
ncbi:MAG: gamma-glutamyl-gamma-aminobutyrate hydrolase family protein [Chloroflexi bacterium]|nr:gamma-glutamyl-gamma-aminobutyrate hydrolase family protein [Chloroflexota bacterium]